MSSLNRDVAAGEPLLSSLLNQEKEKEKRKKDRELISGVEDQDLTDEGEDITIHDNLGHSSSMLRQESDHAVHQHVSHWVPVVDAGGESYSLDGEQQRSRVVSVAVGQPVVIDSELYGMDKRQHVNNEWEKPDLGTIHMLAPTEDDLLPFRTPLENHKILGQWRASAIAGNDVLCSPLYATGLCILQAGVYAPLCALIVGFTLYLYRSIYGESVTALPLNGGAYNVLLNTTSERTATIAAILTILSYVATSVVGATDAVKYLQTVYPDCPALLPALCLLLLFCLLMIMGIGESASVALIIFTTHLISMAAVVISSIIWLTTQGNHHSLTENYHSPLQPPLLRGLIYGFAAAMLGVSGFETAANFVEEQKQGAFLKTLRNLWAISSVFNPTLSLLAVLILPLSAVAASPTDVISQLANKVGHTYLRYWIGIDAFLVLSGQVLTAYVGCTGLARRLALDRILPQFMLKVNKCRGTNHWIIICFFLLSCSMIAMLNGDEVAPARVFTIAFLSVMGLFAVGDIMLKYKRAKIPREVHSSWLGLMLALALTVTGLVGSVLVDLEGLAVFGVYFLTTAAIVSIMFFRLDLLKLMLFAFTHWAKKTNSENTRCVRWVLDSLGDLFRDLGNQSTVFFTKSGTLSTLNKAVLYVRQNEECRRIIFVHLFQEKDKIPSHLTQHILTLDQAYPKLKIDLVLVKGRFEPALVGFLSHVLHVPKNLMFITAPGDISHKLDLLGGVRLVTG